MQSGQLQPIKPHHAATFYVGPYDEKLLAFLPERTPYRVPVQKRKVIECANHVINAPVTMQEGQKIVAVKYPTGTTYNLRIYCCVECQRNHAVEIKSKTA